MSEGQDLAGPIIFCIVGGGWLLYKMGQRKDTREKVASLPSLDRIRIGKYLIGLPGQEKPVKDIECIVTSEDIVFFSLDQEIGSISRSRIKRVFLEDKSSLKNRLTLTRMVTLGVFSLAFPKSETISGYTLVIETLDHENVPTFCVFEFIGNSSINDANFALAKLRQYLPQLKLENESSNEKLCPHCAETIKKAAKICRFCNRDVS